MDACGAELKKVSFDSTRAAMGDAKSRTVNLKGMQCAQFSTATYSDGGDVRCPRDLSAPSSDGETPEQLAF
jgi:hypothetical protein